MIVKMGHALNYQTGQTCLPRPYKGTQIQNHY